MQPDLAELNQTSTVRPRSARFFVPEKIRVDRNVLDRGSSYAMECKIVKKKRVLRGNCSLVNVPCIASN